MRMRSNKAGRKTNKHSGLLLALTAQTVLCIAMIAMAVTLSEYFGMTDIKPAFKTLVTEPVEELQVFAFIRESKPKADEFYDFLKQYLGDEKPKLGMGGENMTEASSPERVVMNAKAYTPSNGTVSSQFGYRVHPITQKVDYHTGVDISSPKNSPIFSAYPGVVAEIGTSKIYGNFVMVDHGNFMTKYCHCESIIAKVGMKVRRGERIAKVGSTGVSTGPHLHFEIIKDGVNLNPSFALS